MDLSRYNGHTPGPWAVEPVNSKYDHDIICDYQVPGDGFPTLLASVYVDEDDGPIKLEQANKNAKLIADAPKLLAEVRRLRAEWDKLAKVAREVADILRAEPEPQLGHLDTHRLASWLEEALK